MARAFDGIRHEKFILRRYRPASQDVKPLKALEGPPHDLGQYYLLMDPGVSGEFFKRLQQVDGAVALDKGARMPGQGKREQDPVELENTVWELILTLAGLK